MKKFATILISFLLICFTLTAKSLPIFAQIIVPLKIDNSVKNSFSNALFYKEDFSEFGLSLDETQRTVKASGNVALKVKRLKARNAAFHVWVDSNLDGKFGEKPLVLRNESKIIVQVNRKMKNGKIVRLPYSISYQQLEKKGAVRDHFSWSSHYKAIGRLNVGKCSADVFLLDFNADGIFDDSDTQATNLQIDRNGDKRIWGKEEHARTNEIIEFCGEYFVVSSIAFDGSSITFQPTNLSIAKVGEIVPKFSVILLNGETLKSENLEGRTYVLDFWATWCVPCVKNLPQIKNLKTEFENKLSVLSINVDEPARKEVAYRIIEKYQIFDFSVIRGLGNDDPMWKSFGSANQNTLSIPLYVLVDKNGIVRYAANGGTNLKDLRRNIIELEAN